jgi:protein-L-isoaspartate(D-aspartate) O-methyltransferase
MIESQLKPCGVVNPRTSAAFFAVPREEFVAEGRRGLAYVDAAQPLGNGRELLSPLSLGLLVEEAHVMPGEAALVVGAATGYSAAILAQLGARVTALESDPALAARARAVLGDAARVKEGPLEAGAADGAPYDLILIDGGVEIVPDTLIVQLAEGGRMVAIVHGGDGVGRASKGVKRAGSVRLEPFAEAAAAILPPFRKAAAFQF